VGASETLSETTGPAGENLLVRRSALAQQVHRQVSGFASYPFSRAQRVEASIGFDAIAFDQRLTTTAYAADTRAQFGDAVVSHSSMPSATVVQTGLALVYDTAIMGGTSPVLGQRYRFGLSQSMGDVRVLTTSADYRRYFMPARNLTLAVRGVGSARLGADAADSRLLPLVWNMRDFVRGYDTTVDTIRTSRFAVGNVELRTPLLPSRSPGGGALPIELFAFTDCGRFWTPDAHATAACAAGGGARLNAAGFVFEFNLARPFISPVSRGWRFGVAFRPGF
jgi:hypothetical protein